MQKLFATVLSVLLLLPTNVSSLADGSVHITVAVPTEHTVIIECGSGGKILYSSQEYTGTNEFKVKRLTTMTATAVPSAGYETGVITSDGNRVTQTGNDFSLEHIHSEERISVTFVELPQDSTAFVPVVGKEQTMSADASILGDAARISVDEEALEYLLNQDTGANAITVDFSELEHDINAVHVPVKTVAAIQLRLDDDSHGMTEFEVKLQDIAVSFDSVALKSIFGQADEDTDEVTVRFEQIDAFETEAIRQAASDAGFGDNIIIVKITLHSGDNIISDFNGGSARVTVPYTPAPGEDTSTISVWYISQDGGMEHVPCEYANGFVSFTAEHFSKFVVNPGIAAEDSAAHCLICRWCGCDMSPWCIILTTTFFLLAACAVTLLILRKKRRAT